MDTFVEKDDDEEDNVLQKPMQAYNVSVNDLKLPNLVLNEDSDASECDEELEALVFHPVLDQAVPTSAQLAKPVAVQPPVLAAVHSHTHEKICEQLTTLSCADLAEIELDNAILSLEPTHSLAVSIDQDLSSLSDSNSSSSSLLGKLEETMAALKKENELENGKIKEDPREILVKANFVSDLNIEQKTVKVDLRGGQVPTNQCVMERYGRSHSNAINHHDGDDDDDDDDDDDTDESRERIKRESELLLLNKGKPKKSQCETGDEHTSRVRIPGKKETLTDGDELSPKDSVDSMLENVNRIICRGANTPSVMTPVNDQHTSSECCEENGEKSVASSCRIKSGKESCVSPKKSAECHNDQKLDVTPCTAETDGQYEDAELVPRSESSVNLEMNTQVVDWGDALAANDNVISLKESNQITCDIKEEISDSIFTNVFFSAAKQTSEAMAKPASITYSKPKKNILNVRGKRLPQNGEIDKTNSTKSSKINFSASKINTDDKNFANKQPADEKPSIIVNCSQEKDVLHCNGILEDVYQNLKEHKKDCVKNGETSELPMEKLNRKLKYSNEKVKDTNNVNNKKEESKKQECLACQINNPALETPMKHDVLVCVNNNNAVYANKKEGSQKGNRTIYATANILNLRDRSGKKSDVDAESVGNCSISNKENSFEETIDNSNDSIENVEEQSVTTPLSVVATKNSKNRKKKKLKNKGDNEKIIELIDDSNKHENHVQRKGVGVSESFWKEFSQGKETLLYDEVTSFEKGLMVIPETSKEILLLKVPLESPGVCKTNANGSINSLADQNSSDNYVGLVTLFIYLLQGSRRDISLPNLGVPFDVVSLQQAHLDSELLLLVGIVENKNTCQQKTKRSKLGTNFFHAVSQYLNANDLEKILLKIWEHTEADISSRIQNHVTFSHIWRQAELVGADQCTIPGRGKLSTLINISPDTNAWQKIHSLYPSVFVHIEDRSVVVPGELSWFHPENVKQEFTCITVENVAAISPKHISELLKRMRKEAVEICGLRILYDNKDNCLYKPLLSICICEFNAATTTEGKLLLSHCEELKELAITFNTQENISVIMNGSPLLKYTINSQRSHRQVVQMFGPHYNDARDMEATLMELKSASKLSNNKNDKKKWAVGSCRELSLLNNHVSSSVLYISELVPSAFISFIISMALKKGLQLKMIYRTCCSFSQLGASEEKADGFTHSDNDKRKSHTTISSCFLLLFCGRSVLFRLMGLVSKLTDILNTPLTGETLQPWMADNMIKFTRSHNKTNDSCKLGYSSKDYFSVFRFNEHVKEFLSKSSKLPKQYIVEDLYSTLSQVQINFMKPEVNLMALLFHGDDILKDVPNLLRAIFSGCSYQSLNSWRESAGCKTWLCSPGSDAVKHRPAIEFIGSKCISCISKLQADNLVTSEHNSAQWEADVSRMIGSRAVLVMLKVIDRRTANQVTESISKLVLSSKSKSNIMSNYVIHSDTEYVFRLMFQYFDLNELHVDQLKDETQIPAFCLPDNHVLLTRLDKGDTSLDCQLLVKKKLPEKDWGNILPNSCLPTTSYVYEFTPKSMNFPLHMLLSTEKSYAGISFQYSPHNIHSIFKALSRMHRMEFQIAALKFPSYNAGDGTCHVSVVISRQDAVFVLNNMVPELEMNFPKLKFTTTPTVQEVNDFIVDVFKGSSKAGGIFHCNYFALLYELNFQKEECFETRGNREVEWNPQACNSEVMWDKRKENIPSSLVLSTDEVSVVILSRPLLCGRYMGRKLTENCIFPSVLQVFETAQYRVIAAKTTMLSKENAREVVELYGVEGKKKYSMIQLLSQEGGPFVVVVLVGSCILANFWLTMVWKLDNDDAVNALKQHTLVPTTKKQVESLLVCLFDKVVQNPKVELKTRLS